MNKQQVLFVRWLRGIVAMVLLLTSGLGVVMGITGQMDGGAGPVILGTILTVTMFDYMVFAIKALSQS